MGNLALIPTLLVVLALSVGSGRFIADLESRGTVTRIWQLLLILFGCLVVVNLGAAAVFGVLY
jgi:hypothetical protein